MQVQKFLNRLLAYFYFKEVKETVVPWTSFFYFLHKKPLMLFQDFSVGFLSIAKDL